MQITVALDGPRRRDIEFYSGDVEPLSIVVYARDGDASPVAVTDVQIDRGLGGGLLSAFTFGRDMEWRSNYTITGLVNGVRNVLAYGLLYSLNSREYCGGFMDYGVFVWGQQPPIIPGGVLQ